MKLPESELKVMEIVWEKEPITAKEVSLVAAKRIGWNKNTTYTILKKLEAKGALRRAEPHFVCTSLVSKAQVQKAEANHLLQSLFDGSKKALFSALLEDEALTREEARALLELIDNAK